MAEKIELDDELALEEAVEKLWVDFFDMAENLSLIHISEPTRPY